MYLTFGPELLCIPLYIFKSIETCFLSFKINMTNKITLSASLLTVHLFKYWQNQPVII